MSAFGMCLGRRPPCKSSGEGEVEVEEACVGPTRGECWFLSCLFLSAVWMHRAKTATSLQIAQSAAGWLSLVCTVQRGPEKVLGGGAIPSDAMEGREFCVDCVVVVCGTAGMVDGKVVGVSKLICGKCSGVGASGVELAAIGSWS